MSPSDRVRLVSVKLTRPVSARHKLHLVARILCGVVHGDSCGVVQGDSSLVVHDNSSGANSHGKSCGTHGGEVLGRTERSGWKKGYEYEYSVHGLGPAVGELAPYSRRQEVCMTRRGQVALGASA